MENVNEIDRKKLKELVLQAKGERSTRQFAKDCNVNPAVISRIINEDYNPSPNMLLRITIGANIESLDTEAKINSYKEFLRSLLNATGTDDSTIATYLDAFEKSYSVGMTVGKTIKKITSPIQSKIRAEKNGKVLRDREYILQYQKEFAQLSIPIILNALLNANIVYQPDAIQIDENKENKYLRVKLISQRYQTWQFDFIAFPDNLTCVDYYIPIVQAQEALYRYVCKEPSPKKKVSIVLHDEV